MSLMDLTVNEIVLLPAFIHLAEEAIYDSNLINETYKNAFNKDTKSIHVYSSLNAGNYVGEGFLTDEFVFIFQDNWWGGRHFTVATDAESIYKMFKFYHMKKVNGTPKIYAGVQDLDYHFREFVKQIHSSKKLNDGSH